MHARLRGPKNLIILHQIINRTGFPFSPRARNRFNQVVEAKRFEDVFLCRKVC